MKAIWNGAVIAESNSTVVVEGNHYFPREALDDALIDTSDKTTVCSWKGKASYFSLVVDGRRNEDAAWYYPSPKHAAKKIAGRVAFWRGVQVVD